MIFKPIKIGTKIDADSGFLGLLLGFRPQGYNLLFINDTKKPSNAMHRWDGRPLALSGWSCCL